jgi:energy-coupling factor transporter transmembrane protein EcfT
MTPSWHAVWGGARGVVVRVAPRTRLLTAACVLLACLLAPVTVARGAALALLVCALWLAAAWPPARVVRAGLALSAVLFAPYAVVAYLGHDTPRESLLLAWSIVVRGACALLVSLATASTLSASNFREAVLGLPLPRVGREIVVQIVHQTAGLAGETQRIAQAMAVRGATGSRAPSWRVLRALPQAWLPRVVERAERVGLAMELRGYCEASTTFVAPRAWSRGDAIALGLGGVAVVLSVATRWAG